MIIKNMIMGLLFYTVEFAKLFPLMYLVLDFRLKPVRKTIGYISAFAAAAMLISIFAGENTGLFCSLLCIVNVIMIFSDKHRILYTIVVYIGVCMFDMLATSFILLFLEQDYEQLHENMPLNLLVNSICIAVVLILVLISRMTKRRLYNVSGRKISFVYLSLILVGELSVLMLITAFQMLNSESRIFTVVLNLSSIAFIILAAALLFNYTSKMHYKRTTEINNKLLVSQENYYNMLLKKDNETMKFRHDINNHLNCMHRMFRSGKYDELGDYFEKLCGSLTELRPVVQTGNDMISAILNEAVDKHPDVSFRVEGRMVQDIKLSSVDLCTIFSNLFDNAFTAACESEEKTVEISFKFVSSNLFCEIKNSVNHKVEIVNNMLQTDKADKENHGFGTANARECAERNEGTLTFRCTDDMFVAELMLPSVY